MIINIERFGNTTAATIPLALNDAVCSGRLKKGDLVLLASVGAGFTVGAVLVRWGFLTAIRRQQASDVPSTAARRDGRSASSRVVALSAGPSIAGRHVEWFA